MKPAKLLQHVALYPLLARYQFKKDIPKGTPGMPMLLSFGIWGSWYCVNGYGGLLLKDGRQMPIHIARLNDFGTVVGQRDASLAEGTPMEEAWRESIHNGIKERLNLA